ncbi:MAG: NAD-dependent DNA ligase LigA [Fusobacteriaceae bacterium]|jgi:DNA ligase (NAD+)|nr:NAD-dependent DNA ligase LigA [Fusobacteriaceae bacterium]
MESLDTIKEKIINLQDEIKKYSYYYYSKNESLVSDVEFDKKLKELEELENKYPEFKAENSPTITIGSSLKDTKFRKITHKRPMLSLTNSYNIHDVIDFSERINKLLNYKNDKLCYALELKLDGASISLQYEDGKLITGVTRGDGIEGEDVTENIYAIKSIPKILKEKITMEVRGEIIFPKSKFIKLNEKRLAEGEDVFANPRNAASGTLRQIDAQVVAERELDAYFYFLVDAKKFNIETHSESISYLEKLGFQTTGVCELLTSMNDMEKRILYWENAREALDYETDGMVIKLDNMNLWEEIGYTTKSPRWAIAYKFQAKQISTVLMGITWQVGRTGKITPVAELEEVELSGSKIKRASLHNTDEILRKDIKIGDRVFIEKAAEIIPQVVSPIKELRNGSESVIDAPINCPSCGQVLEREEGLVDLKCVNPICPAIIQGTIEYFVSRDAMNISGLGSKIVEKFLKLGYIKDVTDIYNLKNHREELVELDKMGEKSITNLLEAIENSKKRSYSKTLYALGIQYVGKFVANLLAKKSKNIDNLAQMSVEELLTIDEVGNKIASSVYEFFNTEKSLIIVEKLKKIGINFSYAGFEINEENYSEENETNKHKEDDIFIGKKFLFTGKMTRFKREDIKDIVESLGGENLSGVSKKLDYLIVGDDAGSKLEKARALGTVTILSEEEFINLCGDKIKI